MINIDPIDVIEWSLCCVEGIAENPCNNTITKVVLLVGGLFYIGLGIYGATLVPQMIENYLVIGLGLFAFVLDIVLIGSRLIAGRVEQYIQENRPIA